MLKRKMMQRLKDWRTNKQEHNIQECLLIKGARQVGKSYIVREFGEQEYESMIYIDFIEEPRFKQVFETSISAEEIYKQLSALIPGIRYVEHDTLIVLDEIQECPLAHSALKYLALDGRYDVIATGSLLGIAYREEATSIPVGYERHMEMYPLDFEEFLWSRGYDSTLMKDMKAYFINLEPVPLAINQNMMRLLREYLAIGGMPAVVQAYADTSNFSTVFEEQRNILASYLDDIARYATSSERVKARACYESLPRQLAKENTKFKYSAVEKGGTSRKFMSAVDWLTGSRITLQCTAVSRMQFPLASYEEDGKFRLYANDTGLLVAMLGFEMINAIVDNTLTGPMKGGLYENLIASMLTKTGNTLRYWMSSNATEEIEFLLERDASVIPVEVKSSKGATASLNAALSRPEIKYGYKLIDGNIGKSDKKITLPLYMACFI